MTSKKDKVQPDAEQAGENMAAPPTDTLHDSEVVEARSSKDHPQLMMPSSPWIKVFTLSVLAIVFLTSILLNISAHFTNAESAASEGFADWILVFGLIIISIICMFITFWNYHMRSIYLKNGLALVPEKWGRVITNLESQMKKQHSQSQSTLSLVKNNSDEQQKKSNALMDSFLTLQKALDMRDEEITRLKKGHDAKVFGKFLSRFIRIAKSLQEMKNEHPGNDHQKNYEFLNRLMQDALEECGVEEYSPIIGSDYRDAGPQIADGPVEIETQEVSKDYQIAEITSIGYVIYGEGGMNVIVPAEVSVYRKFNKTTKEEK